MKRWNNLLCGPLHMSMMMATVLIGVGFPYGRAFAVDYNLVTEAGTSFVRSDSDGGFSVFGPLGVIVVEPADIALASPDITSFFGGHYLVHWPDDGSTDDLRADREGGFEVLSEQQTIHVEPDDNGTFTVITEGGELVGWAEPILTSGVMVTRFDEECEVGEANLYVQEGSKSKP